MYENTSEKKKKIQSHVMILIGIRTHELPFFHHENFYRMLEITGVACVLVQDKNQRTRRRRRSSKNQIYVRKISTHHINVFVNIFRL